MNHQTHQYRAARKAGTYFQVPLCAFAYGSTIGERLNAIISYGMVEAGKKWWLRTTDDKTRSCVTGWANKKPVGDYKRNESSHWFCVRGGEITNVEIGSIRVCLDQRAALKSFCEAFIERHGATPEVRLKTGLVFEARDGKGISARELSVLAAIYSIIGNKHGPVLITQKRIRCRALGYKSAAVMQAELPSRTDGGHSCPLLSCRGSGEQQNTSLSFTLRKILNVVSRKVEFGSKAYFARSATRGWASMMDMPIRCCQKALNRNP